MMALRQSTESIGEDQALPAVSKIARDLRKAEAAGLSADRARYFVDLYYQIQRFRITAGHQTRAAEKAEEPSELLSWLKAEFLVLEGQVQKVLGDWAALQVPGRWLQSIVGIGPVLSAAFLAYIDIEKAPTVGHIWRFAGLDPTVVWEKGKKRPHCAELKVICWKAGDSFVKQSGHPADVYGKIYRERKALEVERNLAGLFAEQAAETLAARKIRDPETLATYRSGKLPDGRIDMRARRYAVKLLLAHLHHVMYEDRFGESPPKPYVITHLGHVHYLGPPNWPLAE